MGLGLGLGVSWTSSAEFAQFARSAEATGWDSIWLSEHLTGPTPAALPALAYAAAVTSNIRLGTSITVVPGRSPVELAKTLWTIAELCDGRLLPIFGLGTAEDAEHAAFNVGRRHRGPWFDAALPVIRALLRGDRVTASSPYFNISDTCVTDGGAAAISDLWMGGRSQTELRRVAKLSDGWLASFATPLQTRNSIAFIVNQAAEMGREFDKEHFGLLLPYGRLSRSAAIADLLDHAYPGIDPDELCPVGVDALRRVLDGHAKAGVTKFILVPDNRPTNWSLELKLLRDDVVSAAARSEIVRLAE
ncbi:LLM class flavin-dependent oxidoreductase [Williamsia serinedens]|uniref:F420-dependent oxidoreductase, MSMEG_3544 family n=1 Tax=Williamsia serinedens TaxID=391736 RepID=A0ABT1GWA9_9NOCA|nr:LLM class flavin-dependent oxidoreductase [Williamsia serinedens]MCP2159251.1 putative F420-dependent oxidoreductase, MSMEG_3544 family [Williamsia serinedens]